VGCKLQRLGYSPRVVSRLTKAATRLAAADGTVSQGLLDRLPGDPIKLEALCALPLADVERIVIEHDCRQLDRTEVAALVREQTGKKAASEKKSLSPTEAIRASWAQSVEALLKKIDKIESENEREELIEHLEESLDDLKEALHEVEDEGTESEGQDGEHEAADLADQERDEDAVDSHGKESAEKDETEAKPVRAHEVPRPQKADRPAGGRPVGRPRAKAQPA